MLGLVYPESQAPHTSLLNSKEMVIYQNLYSHFCNTKHKTPSESQKYALMTVLKQKYNHLAYNKTDEYALKRYLSQQDLM
jgi:hypothetical protein